MSIIKMSVVVPTHGRVDLFKKTLDCLLEQTIQNFEVIVTDDSALKQEQNQIKALVSKAKNNGLNVKYIFTKPNLKQARNTNQGLKEAKGKYMRILHSDDVLAPNCLEMEIKAFETYPQCNFITHSAINFSDKISFNLNAYFGVFDLMKYWLNHNIFLGCVLPTSLAFKREVYDRVGGMNEKYDFLCDWDFFFRILLDGFKRNELTAIFFSKGLVGWRNHSNSITSTMSLACFNEHKFFIDSIIPIYKKRKIISSKLLKQNLRDAIDFRYNRVIADYQKFHNFKLPYIPLKYHPKYKKYMKKLKTNYDAFMYPILIILKWCFRPLAMFLQVLKLIYLVIKSFVFRKW